MIHVIVALQTVVKVQLGLCFTDSKVVLYWILGNETSWQLVQVDEFLSLGYEQTACTLCLHLGRDNPADIPSRGVSPKELEMSLLWRRGPDWLHSIPSIRRSEETTMPEGECAEEMKVKGMPSHSLLISTEHCGIGTVIDCGRFSKLQKLLKVTAYVALSLMITVFDCICGNFRGI